MADKERDIQAASVAVEIDSAGRGRVVLAGRLDAGSMPGVWARVVEPLRAATTASIDVDASGLSYCDGTGLGLLIELKRIAAENGGQAEIAGLSKELAGSASARDIGSTGIFIIVSESSIRRRRAFFVAPYNGVSGSPGRTGRSTTDPRCTAVGCLNAPFGYASPRA